VALLTGVTSGVGATGTEVRLKDRIARPRAITIIGTEGSARGAIATCASRAVGSAGASERRRGGATQRPPDH
jgi:hypothetical protein